MDTLFFDKEVRAADEHRSDPALVTPKQLGLAKMFVQALAASFDPTKLKDQFEESLRALIEKRASITAATNRQCRAARPAAVPDILEALKKSLAMAKRPQRTETKRGSESADQSPRQENGRQIDRAGV